MRLKGTPGAGRSTGKKDPLQRLSASECLSRLKETKLLAVKDDKSTGPAGEVMGVKVEHLPFAELNAAWKEADKDESRAVADRWTKAAKKVEGAT